MAMFFYEMLGNSVAKVIVVDRKVQAENGDAGKKSKCTALA